MLYIKLKLEWGGGTGSWEQVISSRAKSLSLKLKQNMLYYTWEQVIEEMDVKMRDLQVTQRETEVVFECDNSQFEQFVSVLGQLIERQINSTPDYHSPRPLSSP